MLYIKRWFEHHFVRLSYIYSYDVYLCLNALSVRRIIQYKVFKHNVQSINTMRKARAKFVLRKGEPRTYSWASHETGQCARSECCHTIIVFLTGCCVWMVSYQYIHVRHCIHTNICTITLCVWKRPQLP